MGFAETGFKGFVYFLQGEHSRLIKIGYTGNDPDLRLAGLQTGCPDRLVRLGYIVGTMDLEKELHAAFAAARSHGEWFYPGAMVLDCIRRNAKEWIPDAPRDHPESERVGHAWELDGLGHLTPDRRVRLLDKIAPVPCSMPPQHTLCPMCRRPLSGTGELVWCRQPRCTYGKNARHSIHLRGLVGVLLGRIEERKIVSGADHDVNEELVARLKYVMGKESSFLSI